jgi:hypothetical protein
MSALTKTVATGFMCECTCPATFELTHPETIVRSVRWYIPESAEFYEAGWVYKRGRDRALTYCPDHAHRAYRCTCAWAGVKESCASHGANADIRRMTPDRRPRLTSTDAPASVDGLIITGDGPRFPVHNSDGRRIGRLHLDVYGWWFTYLGRDYRLPWLTGDDALAALSALEQQANR